MWVAWEVFTNETGAEIYVLTETRLAETKAGGLSLLPYYLANDSSFIPDVAGMRGVEVAVAILIHRGVACEEVPRQKNREFAIPIYLYDNDVGCLETAGIYFPPKAARKLAQVARLTELKGVSPFRGERIGQLVVVNFNYPGWGR